MIGKKILHYKIIEKLGEGGMGVVYLAEDTKLERKVAIKFLPYHVAADSNERKRFEIEAKAAAALNHTNIATIYSIEESDNELFIVMEYISGKHLKEHISSNPLSIDEAIDTAIQIARGLQEAHNNGVVHRDIKSANIMSNEKGQVKIMDFGLAKVGTGIQLTKELSTLGTAAYMSPEQAKGEEIDQRSDIWSFGIVLYEMLTGTLPFKGDYEQAVIYSILNEEPVAIDNNIPDKIKNIIGKALAKNPDDRYNTAEMLLADLEQLQSESGKRRINSKISTKGIWSIRSPVMWTAIILTIFFITFLSYKFFNDENDVLERVPITVIDFINETDEKELNGLSGMLITALEQSRHLAVVTRSRMFNILDQLGKKDINRIDESLGKQICKQANINAMVVASIRKFGSLYTIDLKVLDPEKDEYIFTAKEEAQGQENIPSMLDNLSEKTRSGLKERVTQIKESSKGVASVTTANLEAYQHFFLGEQLIDQLKFNEAIEEFKEAVHLDSTFAQAYYRMAYAESWQNNDELLQKKHIEKALKFFDKIPEKERYFVRAQIALSTDDYEEAINILRQMEQIYPEDKEMIYNIGDWSYHLSDFTTAVNYFKKTLHIDPNHQRALQHLTWTYRDIENYEKMLETAKKHVAISGSEESYQLLGDAYSQLGQFEQGIKSLLQARDLFPEAYHLTHSIANVYISQDMLTQAEVELKKLVGEKQPNNIKIYGYNRLSDFYPYQGKYSKAIHMLDKRIELLKQLRDNEYQIALNQLFKGFHFINGWNDIKNARLEVEKTIPVQDKTTKNYFWGSISLSQVYLGDYNEAVVTAKTLSPHWWPYSIQALIYSIKGDLENTKIFADSVIQTGSGFAMMFVLYPLAECQYENGQFDKALKSLDKMQKIYDPVWIRGIYYPKSYYLMGKIYEKKGETNLAIKNYEKFLDLWKEADEDLPDLVDAKERYAKLKELAAK